MTLRYRRAVLAPLALVAACAAPPAGPPGNAPAPGSVIATATGVQVRLGDAGGELSSEVEGRPDAVWALLPEVYRDLGIAIELHDAGTRTIGTRRFTAARVANRRTSDFVRCGAQSGAGGAMNAYRTRLTIVTTVAGAPDGRSRLATEVSGTGTPVEGTSTAAVRCVSTGELERLLHQRLEERLRAGSDSAAP